MAIVAISIAPSGQNSTSLSEYVAKALAVVAKDDRVTYRLDPMFTTLEGSLSDCLEICEKMHEELFKMGVSRVGSVIKIDDRRDKVAHMEDKIKSVMSKL
ncbi:MTH1187 family thiamine-binding protein [bacterium]|nr:MTH1187 family thiamine-binding protein [bacterium]